MDYKLLLNDEILANLGQKIKRHRINQNLTGKELAEKSGISLRTLTAFEKGQQNLSLINFIEILRALRLVDNLKDLLPEIPAITPIEMMELEKKRKKRIKK